MPDGAESSLEPMFRPRGVAVIGASREQRSIGNTLLRNLVGQGFTGTVFPVNPHATSVHSVKCYADVRAIEDPVDLAVIAVPAARVPEVLAGCCDKGVRAVCVVSAGFAETGPEGVKAQARLREVCRAHGIRLLGPNCMGLMNASPEVRLNATFADTFPRPGAVSFLSQSGAMGVAVLDLAEGLGLGMRMFASLGNKADVSGNDLLTYWEHDEGTRVALMYLEDFGNPRKFIPIARRFTRHKPIVCVKAGRTAEGGRAAASHTGALAGQDAAVDALLEQTGVLRVDSVQEMFGVAQALVNSPLPRGPRVALLTNAGGPAILATDYLVAKGLALAHLAEPTKQALRTFLMPQASVANPVDMVASAGPAEWARALPLLLQDPGVDLVLTISVPISMQDSARVAQALFTAAEDAQKPVLATFLTREPLLEEARRLGAGKIPIYAQVEDAVRAAANLVRVRALMTDDLGEPKRFAVTGNRAHARLSAPGEGWLPMPEVFALLEAYGLPCVPTRNVASAAEAVAAARALGGPVALKLEGAKFVHKSDVGGVALNVEGDEAVKGACARLAAAAAKAAPAAPYRFTVQPMAKPGTELVLGVSTDPVFGPLVMVGLGGVFVEILKDVRFGLVPLTPVIAHRMLTRLKSLPILEGARGGKAVDLAAIEEALLRVSQLVEDHPEIVELDVNPLLARPDGIEVLDARIRVSRADAAPATRT